MTTPYSGYGYGRATRRERAAQARRDRIIANYWHSRLTHALCNGAPYCDAYNGRYTTAEHSPSNDGHAPRRHYTGHLRAPCSRYGHDGDECAWWAIAAAFAVDDDAPTWRTIDYYQGLAVNNSDGLCELVWAYWSDVPPYVRRQIGTRADVLALAFDPRELVNR